MATYIFYIRVIGKSKIDNFSFSVGIFLFFSKFMLEDFLLNSPLGFQWFLSKSLNLIGCQGDKKGKR